MRSPLHQLRPLHHRGHSSNLALWLLAEDNRSKYPNLRTYPRCLQTTSSSLENRADWPSKLKERSLPDIILARAFQMPTMDGLEATGKFVSIRRLIFSGRQNKDEDRERCIQGADGM
jgi:CheY-like chemotaxis protein